jgi:hypothetical protein
MSVTRENVSGFLLGISVGVGIGSVLRSLDQKESTARDKPKSDRERDFSSPTRSREAVGVGTATAGSVSYGHRLFSDR